MSENSIPSRIEYSKEVWQEYMSVLANSTKSNNNKLNSSTCSVISLNKLNHVSDGNSTSSKVKDVDSNSNYSLTDSLSDIEMNDNISEQNENNNLNRFDNSTEEISIRNMQISIDHTTTNHDNCHKISKSHESNNGNKQTKTDNYNRFETTHSHDYKNPRKENPKPYEFEELSTGKVTRTLGRKGSLEQTSSSEQNNYSEKNKKMKQISSHEQNNYSEMIKRIKQIIPCLKGLQNHGNTCYFNALMQCLANCESFAQFLLCNNFVFSNEFKNYLFYLFVHTIRCIWFNHPNVDYYCGKTVKCIGKMNSDFVFGSQHDSHECMIWLLNKIQNEVVIEVENKIDYYLSDNSDIRNHGVGTSHMSIDHLPSLKHKRDEDSILNLFRCTLRHEIKCMNRNCDFIQTSLEPCLSVSLSVPSPRKININFIFNNPKRDGYRFSCEIFDNSLTIKDLKYQIMNEVKNVSLKNMIAYLFKPDGESMFLKDDLPINKSLTELTIFEIPEQSDLPNNYIRSIVIFVIGDFPNSKMIGMPFVASLKNNLNYKELGFELLKEGKFLLPDSYYKMTQNFKINLQTSDNSGIMDNEINKDKPLCLDVLPESEYGNILRIIVEWDLSLKYEFENIRFNFINRNKSFNNHFDLKPIQLINLIDNFVKTEPIENWECDKCGKESGYIRICFESMPDILVFYLKRFATSNHTIKNDRNVAIPFEGLNLDKYVHKSNNNIYNLTSVIYHHGGTIKFGHYTSANKNCVDHQWRLFNDLSVSILNNNNNINISSNSYMLFYQKQKHTSFSWFPENIPKNIIEYYSDEVKAHNQNNNRSGKNDGRTNNGSKDGITSYSRRFLSWLLGFLLRLFHR